MPKSAVKMNSLNKSDYEPVPSTPVDVVELEQEAPEVKVKKPAGKVIVKKPAKQAAKRAPKKIEPLVEQEPEDNSGTEYEDVTDSDFEQEVKAPPKRATKKEAKPKKTRGPSLWMTVLKENGFMVKGGEFKPTPKKGSADYEKVKKIFDERKEASKSK